MIEIYAGNKALNTIQEHGFKQDLFRHFLGASGGPKWFVLFGLDKYLFSDFFKNRESELNLIGSSAGAFRAACLTQKNPIQAINNLAYKYANTVYSKKPTPLEISNSAKAIVDALLADSSATEIIENKIFKAHFIVAKCQGFSASEHKLIQAIGLLKSMAFNRVDRKLLSSQYQRYIFKSTNSNLLINDPYGFKNHYQNLTIDNIKGALLASGSIPMIMAGVKNIADSPSGIYRDGGIIDYHFDFALNDKQANHSQHPLSSVSHADETKTENAKDLILYPHFSNTVKAGWFDKNSKRKVLAKNYENTVLIAPSKAFVDSLPYKKIPDRTDFTNLDSTTRIKYWESVLAQTTQLADSFNEFVIKQKIELIKPFTP